MKHISLLFLLTLKLSLLFAQTPNQFKYQAVLRNADGSIVANQPATFFIEILSGTTDGPAVFTETHNTTTSSMGIVNLTVGSINDLGVVDWSTDNFFIKVTVDEVVLGTIQLLSVPYALHAKTAENISGIVNETDPVYLASEAANIKSADITNLSNLSGINTGDQDVSSLATQIALEDTASAIRTDIPDVSGFISAETDPFYIAWNKNYTDLTNKPNIRDTIQAVLDTTSQFLQIEVDGDITNEIQSISRLGLTVSLTDGGSYTDSVNTQTLSITGNDLSISSGNTITLPDEGGSVPVYTTTEILALSPVQGDAIFNSTEKLYQIYEGGKWQSFSSNCWPQPTLADAGIDQIFNDGTTSTTLTGNLPNEGHGTGLWTIVSGTGGSFVDETNPLSGFTGLECTDYILKWTISTNCNSSSDNVLIEYNKTPTTADAGIDQIFNDETTSTTLEGNFPDEGHGTGLWTIVSGTGGSFVDETNPITGFTGLECTDYILKWTISTDCSSSSDNVLIGFNQISTLANAGNNQIINGETITTLAANTAVSGSGEWSIISGSGGSFSDSSSPTTEFTGELGIYKLRWTITSNCDSNTDDVYISFNPILTDADGNNYNTVLIGSQLWMAENLKVTQEADGTPIATVTDVNSNGSTNDEWGDLNYYDKAYCYYNNNVGGEAAIYGALYTFEAAENACPTGWHLPTDEDWMELVNFINTNSHQDSIGVALKATIGWDNDGNGTDDYGFSAIPGGGRNSDGVFSNEGREGYWWGSEDDTALANIFSLWSHFSEFVIMTGYGKSYGHSIRCVKN
jgi:uncharacterized protein (TIGR02145 family)